MKLLGFLPIGLFATQRKLMPLFNTFDNKSKCTFYEPPKEFQIKAQEYFKSTEKHKHGILHHVTSP